MTSHNRTSERRTAAFLIIAVLCAATSLLGQTPKSEPSDEWRQFRFLLGTWESKTQGGSANAARSGKYTFAFDFHDHVIVRRSATDKCKGPADFNCDHSDILYIYREAPRQRYQAIYFDSEGHAIHYFVAVPAPNTVIFLSDSTAGPQYRLSYELKDSVMNGRFQMRMPEQSQFITYLEWSGKQLP